VIAPASILVRAVSPPESDAPSPPSSLTEIDYVELGDDSEHEVSPVALEKENHPPVANHVLSAQIRRRATAVTFLGFTSVQVNVDALGQDILGDAANEPSIAVDPTDHHRMAVGWRQFDSIASDFREGGYAFTTDGGATWTFPGVLQNNQFRSDPVLASDGNGIFYYSSLSALDSVEVFRSLDGGMTWLGPVDAFGGDKQWMIADDRASGLGAGNLYQIWNVQFTCCPPNDFTRSIDGGLSFQSPIAAPTMKWGTMDTGPDGTLYLAGSNLGQSSHVFGRSTNAKNPGVTPFFDASSAIDLGGTTSFSLTPNPAGLLGQVWIAADPSQFGRVFILASVNPPGTDPLDVNFIRSDDNGVNWTEPIRINDDPASGNEFQWFGTISVAPNGRIDVIWLDTRNGSADNFSQLFYSTSWDSGDNWSRNLALGPIFDSHDGWPIQNKMGDYFHMISDVDGADLAYAATYNGGQDVYYLRIPADCDGNGVEDACDVSCGAPGSRCDVLGCGLAPDCNDNQRPDICDVSSGYSADDDIDLTPDECEGACCDCNGCQIVTPDLCVPTAEFSGLGTVCGGAGSCVPPVIEPNDDCAQSEPLPADLVQSLTFDNRCATGDGPPSVSCELGPQTMGADLWFTFVPDCDGDWTAQTCASNPGFDTIIALYGGEDACSCPGPLDDPVDCADDLCGGPVGLSSLTGPVLGGKCYLLRVGGHGTATGEAQLNLVLTPNPVGGCDPIPPSPQPLSGESDRNRFLSFSVPPSPAAGSSETALRVTLVSLQHPAPPNAPCCPPFDYSLVEVETRWVGPPQSFPEASDSPGAGNFVGALLQCQPFYHDWASVGPMHVTGFEVTPSSIYEIAAFAAGCAGNENVCVAVSSPISLSMSRWGDVVPPFVPPSDTTQPDFADISAIVDKFKSVEGAISKVRAQLQSAQPDPAADVSILDISACVDAFKGLAYPYPPQDWPTCTP